MHKLYDARNANITHWDAPSDVQYITLSVYDVCRAFHKQLMTRNSSGDEIVNVNFLYDNIIHVL